MRRRKPLSLRRAERELFFWTAREVLLLILLASIVAAAVVGLITGQIDRPSDLLSLSALGYGRRL